MLIKNYTVICIINMILVLYFLCNMLEKGCIKIMKFIKYPNLHINSKLYNKGEIMYNKTETTETEMTISQTTLESSLNYYHKDLPDYFYI